MSDADPAGDQEPPHAGRPRNDGGVPAEVETSSSAGLTYSQTTPGEWDVTRARHELKAATTAHAQQLEAEQARHDREEFRKDNDQRRQLQKVMFSVVVGTIVGMLIISLVTSLAADSNQTKEWARSIVSLIVGGLAGYITGKSGCRAASSAPTCRQGPWLLRQSLASSGPHHP